MLTYEEYKRFVESTERNGGTIVFYASFPNGAQRKKAKDEYNKTD